MTIFNFGFTNPFANGAPSNEIEAFPDEDRGLGIAFDETEGKPEMKGLNGLFNKISQSLLSIKQNGLIGWTSDIEYIQGGFTIESGKLYQAIRNNTGKQPSLSQNDWTLWVNPSNITVDSNGNITKTVNTDGSFSLKVNDATTTVKGVARFATATEVANKINVSAAVTPKNVVDMFTGGFGSNDSLTLPSGHVLKWGTVEYSSYPGESQAIVNFPVAFPNTCLNITATRTMQSHTNSGDGGVLLISASKSSAVFSLQVFDSSSVSSLRGFTWFAIGY